MKKWNMIVDVAKCHDCNNCFISCKDEHVGNDWKPFSVGQPWHGHRWMNIQRKERGQYPKVDVGYLPMPCMHCEDAKCMKAAKNGAVRRREDGIVLIDPEKAKGQKDLVNACPYGAIYWNAEKTVPQKCTFCAHLLEEGWKQPRCVQACPTGALQFVQADDAEMQKRVKAEALEAYLPDLKAKPHVWYKNLYRFTKCFIAGSVALQEKNECAEGAKVTLSKGSGKPFADAVTNNYGDFKFDDLDENSGSYSLEVTYPGYKKQKLSVELKASVNVGTVFL
jgi:Fe-S-cluster-containing dehydrogenase component